YPTPRNLGEVPTLRWHDGHRHPHDARKRFMNASDILNGVSPGLIFGLIIVVLGILIIAKGLVVVRQSEVMVIERLGSFNRLLESGINIIVPFIDQPRAITMIRYRKVGDDYHAIASDETRIDRRETVMDFPGQPVVTTDNVTVTIN